MLTRRASFPAWCVAAVIAIAATIGLQNYRDPATGQPIHFTYYFPFCFGTSFAFGWLMSMIWPGRGAGAGLTVWSGSTRSQAAESSR